jgi:hypothetical protein
MANTVKPSLFQRLFRHVLRWGAIEGLFLLCCGATWKYFESTEYAPYVVAGGFALTASLATFKLLQRKKRPWLKFGLPLVVFASLGAVLCFGVSVATNREWQPPKLPPKCEKVSLIFGSDSFDFPLKSPWLTGGKAITKVNGVYYRNMEMQLQFGGKLFKHPVRPEIKRNRLYVSVLLPYQTERKRISMDNALDGNLPPKWDRNFSTNAFEIVKEDNTPLLQVIYKRPDVIEVYGVFVLDENQVFVTFGPTNSMWLQNVTADSTKITADSTAQILSQAAFEADFVKRKSIFKYPSSRFQGVYAE